MTLADLLLTAADTLPLWRSPACLLLGIVALGCLRFAAEAWE